MSFSIQNLTLYQPTLCQKQKKTTSEKKDIKNLDKAELHSELIATRKELFSLTMKHSLGELKQPHLIRKARRSVAQISTALSSSL
jgi:large subunit ribosomal protein L29